MNCIDTVVDRRTSTHTPSDGSTLEGLLEDPAIGNWAREAAAEGRMSPLDALGLLAQALVLDARR
jgi:hypothetical protein